jgi:hypothetical protein
MMRPHRIAEMNGATILTHQTTSTVNAAIWINDVMAFS